MSDARLRELTRGLELQTDLWWLATMFAGLLGALLAALAFPGAGEFWVWLVVLLRLSIVLCLVRQPWGLPFRRLLEIGAAAGVFWIFADYLTVTWEGGGRRVYPGGSAELLESPLYFPALHALSVVDFGYPALRLYAAVARRWPGEVGLGAAMIASGLAAGVVTVATDAMAVGAGWWSYAPPLASFGQTGAVYVAVARFFAFLAFLPVFLRFVAYPGDRFVAAVRYGAVFAGAVFVSTLAAHLMVERSL